MAKKTLKLETSGKSTDSQLVGGEQTIKLAAMELKATESGGVNVAFGRLSRDASPGWNTLTINGLPAGTRAISVWVTEWASGNYSHAGGAWFTTTSVQLYDKGRKCRVRFHLQWKSHLPAGAQLIFG
jgi:hypothetical protein